ncbi:MAG: PAS domain S-box protein, partial [Bacteroidota bacterium]
QAEEDLSKAHQENEKLLNLIDGIVWKADARTLQFIFVSKQAERILGYPIDQWLSNPTFWKDHIHVEDQEWAVSFCLRATADMRSHQFEYRMIAADGRIVWLRDNVIVTIRNNQPEFLYGIMVDITELKLAEAELRQSEERFRLLAESSITGIYLIQNQKFVYINQALAGIFGYTVDEIVGTLGPLDLTHPDDRPRVIENIRKRMSGEVEDIRYDFRGLKKDGTIIYVEVFGKRIQYKGAVGIIGTLIDITERKQAEFALKENEARYRTIVENLNQAYYEADAKGRFTYYNPGLVLISGYTEEELLRTVSFHLIAEEHRRQIIQLYKQWFAEKRTMVTAEFKVQTKSGKKFWVEQITHFEYDSNGALIKATNFLRDIDERKRAEENLQRSREEYLQFFMEDITADYITAVDGTVRQCNPAYVNIFGFSSMEEALATNIFSLYLIPQEREKVLSQLLQKRKLEYFELQMVKRDGTPLYLVANIIGKFDDEGKLEEIRGYLFDDTKRRQLEETLRQTQKLESIGTLASGIAHDFNNILGIILGHASLLEKIHYEPERFSQSLTAITAATKRGASLVKQLLTFARKTESVFEPLDVNIIIKELTKMLYETFPRTITIVPQLDPSIPSITADVTQIHQVLLNLCVNARDAMPKGGTLTLTSCCVPLDQLSKRFPQANARQYVELTVSDTGIGMDKQTLSRIFEPFFTTKGVGQGTGLGLAVVHGVLGAHNGFIDVESQPGKGSTFRLYLPATEEPLFAEVSTPASATELPTGTETILIVEDEEYLRQALENYLSTSGYTVLSAANGKEALEIYRARMNDIHLVISDIGLPQMSGDELLRQIKNINSAARVILASGFIDPNVKSDLLKSGVSDIMTKPYMLKDVLLKTRQVLDR